MKKRILFFAFLLLASTISLQAEDGYRLWLRYDKIDNPALLARYRQLIQSVNIAGNSATTAIIRQEIKTALAGLLGINVPVSAKNPSLFISTADNPGKLPYRPSPASLIKIGKEGYIIQSLSAAGKKTIAIIANTDIGLLYGSFHFLRLIQTHQSLENLQVVAAPRISLRMLNHWDNLDGHVERGYAGRSIWNWHTLPDYIDQRYIDYARANASVGINGTVLTNVNANALVLSPMYLDKVTALANTFRPYGIRVYLTARFSAPVEIGGLTTADPLDEKVQQWWADKAKEIYGRIPDFGGFLVKANSEGQPGPQSYGRTHAEGANMLANAVAPFGGIVMWRAFVYGEGSKDRFKQAYEEFHPLDGKFRSNILVQVKNGPIDFQPREPFNPLFGSMPQTPLMMEFQLTQEYLGQGTHLVYEVPMFKEVLNTDSYAKGKGSDISRIIDGSLYDHSLTGIAGVSNIGNERNWTGHPFGQANWYAFGRLAWNENLSAGDIADEWIRQTFFNTAGLVDSLTGLMLHSHETMVNYMTPLGLHHIMGNGHHYGPAPWSDNLPRADWNPVYYHRADSAGIGFDRTATGSDALSQYKPEVQQLYADIHTCDEKYLLWFHHVSWKHTMKSGNTLWEALCNKYNEGVSGVRKMQATWNSLQGMVDRERFDQVKMLLNIQEKEAVWWRNACLLYFQTFSGMEIPGNIEKPDHSLNYYKSLRFPYAPGN